MPVLEIVQGTFPEVFDAAFQGLVLYDEHIIFIEGGDELVISHVDLDVFVQFLSFFKSRYRSGLGHHFRQLRIVGMSEVGTAAGYEVIAIVRVRSQCIAQERRDGRKGEEYPYLINGYYLHWEIHVLHQAILPLPAIVHNTKANLLPMEL